MPATSQGQGTRQGRRAPPPAVGSQEEDMQVAVFSSASHAVQMKGTLRQVSWHKAFAASRQGSAVSNLHSFVRYGFLPPLVVLVFMDLSWRQLYCTRVCMFIQCRTHTRQHHAGLLLYPQRRLPAFCRQSSGQSDYSLILTCSSVTSSTAYCILQRLWGLYYDSDHIHSHGTSMHSHH